MGNKEETELITRKVPRELRKKLKIQAASEGRSMQEIIIDLIKNYVEKEG